jgi:blue copper oxidase
MMKTPFFLLACFYTLTVQAQQPLFIPDTLSGSVINLNMHPDSVQFFPGNISYTYAFNTNKFLGPTLFLTKGNNVTINVTNQITDTTTVHWHGIHLPAIFDGGPHTPILPSATWSPNFTVMDNAATYWYHPHMHMKTAEHVIKGAAGLIIVRDNIESTLTLPRKYGVDDFPVIVQCQQYDSLNQVMPLGMQDSTLTVNGTVDPYLDAPAQVVRLRLLNASGERAFNFGFTADMQFYQIASDGGLLNTPLLTTRVRLAPGERAEVLLDLSLMNGQTFYLMCYGSELPMGVQGGPTMPMPPWAPPMDSPLNGVDYNIMQINVVAPTTSPVTTIPSTLVTNVPYLEGSANAFREIRFTADSAMVMDGPFYFNDSTFNMMRIDYTIPLNSVEVWKLVNETMVAHPFHIHDVQFFILDRNGIAPTPEEAGRKDVVFVLPGDTVRFITKFENFADTVVPYMFHCHILMHEDDGMMGQFIVHPSAVGIEENIMNDDFILFPNPATNFVEISPAGKDSEWEISIYSINGELVFTNSIKGSTKINTGNWNAGMYIVQLKSQDKLHHKKIMIK